MALTFRTGRGGLLTAAAVALFLSASGPVAGQVRPTAFYPEVENLDQPGHASRFAFVTEPVTVRDSPLSDSRRVGRLGLKTEDRTDEVVSIIGRSKDSRGLWWFKVRLPIRPNGSTGWVPRDALGEIRQVDTWLLVDQAKLRMTLIKRGRVVFRAPIGVGKARWPTPKGTFYVRNRLYGPSLGPIYGPLAFGTNARSSVLTDWPGGGVIGIHGTNRPGLLPGRVSHGCIRLRNADIRRLGHLLRVGTPVTIT